MKTKCSFLSLQHRLLHKCYLGSNSFMAYLAPNQKNGWLIDCQFMTHWQHSSGKHIPLKLTQWEAKFRVQVVANFHHLNMAKNWFFIQVLLQYEKKM